MALRRSERVRHHRVHSILAVVDIRRQLDEGGLDSRWPYLDNRHHHRKQLHQMDLSPAYA